jgi:hypothetical protein
MRTPESAFALGLILGCILFAAILGGVFASGSTFGQRCAAKYGWADVDNMELCIFRLSKGGLP